MATLIGGAFSMALGDYLGSKSEREFYEKEKEREEWEVKNYPDGEKKEMV